MAVLTLLLGSSTATAEQSAGQERSRFLGSVPTGQATGTALPLSLKDAFDRALTYNLGLIESDQNARAARAVRLRNLSALLPDVSAHVSSTRQQIDLRALGFSLSLPGVSLPTIVGPFNVADARVYVSQPIFNWADIQSWKSAAESERASRHTYRNDRDLVVLSTGNAYLVVISDHATVDSTRAQVTTAKALYDRAVDQNKAGVIASIDVLRAQVELQTQQQRLIAAENQLAIDKLTLARIIGLPKGQEFQVTDAVPFAPLNSITLDQALEQAYATRPDYLGARAQVRAAELARQAAAAANYPSLSTDADYGDIGSPNFGTSHGTFSVAVTLHVPIFQGTRVRADQLQADAALQQRRAELADLDGRIDEQVRTAFLNLTVLVRPRRRDREQYRAGQPDTRAGARSLCRGCRRQPRGRAGAGVGGHRQSVQHREPPCVQRCEDLARAGDRRCRAVGAHLPGSQIRHGRDSHAHP